MACYFLCVYFLCRTLHGRLEIRKIFSSFEKYSVLNTQREKYLCAAIYIDYFIESATYGFLFTSCKTLENSLVRCALSFVFQSLETSTFYEVIYIYYINTNLVPGELLSENIFTCENNKLSSQAKISLLLWLQTKSYLSQWNLNGLLFPLCLFLM